MTLAHAAFFQGIEEIADAKCELFSSKRMERGFFHLETEAFQAVRRLDVAKTWFDLADTQADITCEDVTPPFRESHLQENFLAAASVALHLGMSKEEIEERGQDLKPFDHRFEKIHKRGILFVDDSYNASPQAMKAALSNLPKGKRKIGFLGAMKELGVFERAGHKEVAECALPLLDYLICIGEACQPMVEVFEKGGKTVDYFKEKEEAVKHLKDVVNEGDVVLLKGSNSLKLWTVLEEF